LKFDSNFIPPPEIRRIMKNIMIIATKDCNHRFMLEEQLKELGTSCKIKCIDDDISLIEKYEIHYSPNLVVDGRVVFRGTPEKPLPTTAELRAICEGKPN